MRLARDPRCARVTRFRNYRAGGSADLKLGIENNRKLVIQSSLRDFFVVCRYPGVETPGYSRHVPPGHTACCCPRSEKRRQAGRPPKAWRGSMGAQPRCGFGFAAPAGFKDRRDLAPIELACA